ncbi:MAG: protease modulator HflC [Pseudomonadota bacterium]
MQKLFGGLGIAAIITIIIASQTLFIVPETHQVLVLRIGDPVRQYSEPGLKWKLPFIEQAKTFDTRVLDVDPPAEQVILADQKRLVIDTFARYKIVDMLEFHKRLNSEAQAEPRLRNMINSNVRSRLGNVPLQDILSAKRAAIMDMIRADVNLEVARFGIDIIDVRIGRADLPEQTSQAIYSRMRSEREQEAAEFRAQGQEMSQEIKAGADRERTVLVSEAQRKAEIIRGEGDEESITIYADAYGADEGFFSFYRSMGAYEEAINTDNSTLVLTPDSDFFRYFGQGPTGEAAR